MAKVSVIIPGRCEPYFQETVDSVLESATGDVEVVAVIDGPGQDPPVKSDDSRVKIIELPKSIGQREGYNLGVRKSTGEYVMKIDAHALLSKGFDEELQSHCPEDVVVLPEMRRLDVKQWKDKPRGKVHFMHIGLDCYCHYWKEYGKRPEAKVEYPEVMTGQGSCWFTTRKWNDHIGLLDPGVGSWGNVGIEISLRTWLCGGSQIVNKKAWQAHWFRKDEGGFTYPMDGRRVAKAHNYTRKNYYFNDRAFANQTRPFRWVIEKFAPVPGWEVYLADGYETKRTIVYYTDHHLEDKLARAIMKNLQKVAGQIPIISVSQKPLSFGRNICVGKKPRANHSIYEQIKAGVEAAPEGSIIYLAEHDVAYNPSHFVHVPKDKRSISYNQNRYYWAPGQTEYLPARGKFPLSQLVAYREFLLEKVNEILQIERPSTEMYKGIKVHRFKSERPNVDIRHGMNFSQDGKWKKDYYKGRAKNTVGNIGHWGSPHHLQSKLSWRAEDPNAPILTRVLREHYKLDRFKPAPIRIKGFQRVDVAKVINLLGLKKGAEVGVAGGKFSEVLLQEIKDCELMCVDFWGTAWSKKLENEARELLGQYPNATILKGKSMDIASQIPDNSLDFVYIDANHEFDYVMEDLIAWGRKVRKGGIIAGHDYDRAHRKGVVPAVNMYAKMHKVQEWFLTDQKREASFFWVKG